MSSTADDLAASTANLSVATAPSQRASRAPPRRAHKPNPNAPTALADLMHQHVVHQEQLRTASIKPLIAKFYGHTAFSQRPLSDLKPMRIADHDPKTDSCKGRYILCRSLGGPVTRDALIFAVEDQDGRIFYLFLLDYPLYDTQDAEPLGPAKLAILFPPGTGFAIREPFIGRATEKTGSTRISIYVFTPTDVEVYRPDAAALSEVEWATASPFRPSSSSSTEQRTLADAARPKRSLAVAVKRMTDALALAETPKDTAAAALHRALVCIDSGRYGLAYRDTSFVHTYLGMGVELSTLDQMQLHLRRCQTLVGLGFVDRAGERARPFQEQAATGKSSGAAFGRDMGEALIATVVVAMRRDITRMLQESEVGVDAAGGWVQHEEEAERAPFGGLKIGHYVGPIRVAQLKKRRGGRGVIATRDIEPGELLLVEPAFALSHGHTTRTSESFDSRKKSPPPATRELIHEVIGRVLDDPSTLSVLEALYDGERPPAKQLVFGSMQERYVSEFSSASINLDPGWVERICSINGLTLFRTVHGMTDELDSWSALFIDGSAFNHSCIANTYYQTLGDTLVVRARTPIKKGKEVYLAYAPLSTLRGQGRAYHLSRHFNSGGCPCAYCVEERWVVGDIVEDRENMVRRCVAITCEMDDTADTATPAALWQNWDDIILLMSAIEASYAPGFTQPQPHVAVACATFLSAATRHPSSRVDDEQRARWYDTLVRASGSRIDDSAPAWRLDPPPQSSTLALIRNTLARARASHSAGGADGRARALGYLSLSARQYRIEYGDDLERFWARWEEDSLEGLEHLKEPLAELLGEAERV
ncbi:hypothetical protein JCM9279_007109 [Rhodotorula babjevae]